MSSQNSNSVSITGGSATLGSGQVITLTVGKIIQDPNLDPDNIDEVSYDN